MSAKIIPTYFDFLEYDDSLTIMDDYVFGSNLLGSKEIFAQRKKYQQTHPSAPYMSDQNIKMDEFFTYLGTAPTEKLPVPINFWKPEQSKYGRHDISKNYIYPKEFYYKQIGYSTSNGENLFALGFVVDAFEDLMKYIKVEKIKYLVQDNFIFNDLKPVRALRQLQPLQERVFNAHYEAFKTMIIENPEINSRVVDFESFLENFLNVYGSIALKEYPLTKTGLLQSNKVGPNVSGLCIELSKDPHDKDTPKREKYFDSPNYFFYAAAAAQFGFMVDMNAPWRLVANIYSPKMRKYIQKYFQNFSDAGFTTSNLDHAHYYEGYHSLLDGATNPKNSIEATKDMITYNNQTPTPHTHVITKDGEISIEVAYGNNPVVDHTHGIDASSPITDWQVSHVYQKFYTKTSATDLNDIRSTAINMYIKLVSELPTVNTPKVFPKKKNIPIFSFF